MERVGGLSWAERTGGRLSARETVELLLDATQTQVATMPSRVAYTLGLRRDRLAVDLDEIPVPDTPAAKAAAEACDAQPDFLAAHSYRTYLWGSLLARHDGLAPDPELLWVASLTHDTGLEPAIAAGDETCFTLRSAQVAREIGERAGWARERADAAAHAVTMHFNMRVPEDETPEARLVNAGAGVDVAGLRRWEIAPETVAAVVARHPRLGFEKRFPDLLGQHTRHAPRTRCGIACRLVGFRMVVRRSAPRVA